ncbi:MAG: hypothetical protein HUK07_05985, partial [Bacteroidaceae bacterium]|nr:hypothetical protein [Bacteroidaceae bacterium]
QTVSVSAALKWLEFSLDNPYTITGEEPCLYIGYTGDISVGSSMLMGDLTADSECCSYVFKDGEWVDTYGMGYGNVSVRVGIADAPVVNDLMMKPLPVEGYFKAGENYTMLGQLFNCGNTTITSFDLKVKVEGSDEVISNVVGVSIAPGETCDFILPEWCSNSEGDVALNMQVSNVNGLNDSDSSDNGFDKSIFCYPATMERNILLEGFTGQACSNCPTGHKTISNFMAKATTTPIIEVMHHSGYRPDYFSMDDDYEYTYFYGSSGTYAPAVMLNRAATFDVMPVMNTDELYLTYVYDIVENYQPYVSLKLNSEFDAATRELKIDFSSYAHADLPAENIAFNVMLVQDGLVSKQTPYGDGYVHNAVFRGTATGNAWGYLLNDEAIKKGGEAHWHTKMVLPESIYSNMDYDGKDSTKCVWPAIPENMRLVAYVAAHGNTPASRQIYNAIEVPLGGSHSQGAYPSAIKSVINVAPNISVRDGRIVADGEYDSMKVYSCDGRMMHNDATLPSGIYIVRVNKGTNSKAIKVRIR